jgi:hypothetical protein
MVNDRRKAIFQFSNAARTLEERLRNNVALCDPWSRRRGSPAYLPFVFLEQGSEDI